jgi:DNA-binding MarR family transcriptional regulator
MDRDENERDAYRGGGFVIPDDRTHLRPGAIARAAPLGEQFDIDANELIFTLVRTANIIATDFDSNIWRPLGLSYAGFRLIYLIWIGGPMETRTIARLDSVTRASISSLVSTLERDGYVIRSRESVDRRMVVVRLTDHSREFLRENFPTGHMRERRWVDSLTPSERTILIELLRKMIKKRP